MWRDGGNTSGMDRPNRSRVRPSMAAVSLPPLTRLLDLAHHGRRSPQPFPGVGGASQPFGGTKSWSQVPLTVPDKLCNAERGVGFIATGGYGSLQRNQKEALDIFQGLEGPQAKNIRQP